MKVKTSELTGAALTLCVARCIHKHVRHWPDGRVQYLHPNTDWTDFNLDWAQGGPLLERFFVVTGNATYGDGSIFEDTCYGIIGENPDSGEHLHREFGPNRLVAGMRCIVASELGDEVDVPEELLCS